MPMTEAFFLQRIFRFLTIQNAMDKVIMSNMILSIECAQDMALRLAQWPGCSPSQPFQKDDGGVHCKASASAKPTPIRILAAMTAYAEYRKFPVPKIRR